MENLRASSLKPWVDLYLNNNKIEDFDLEFR